MSQNILLPLTVVELEDLATVKALELAIDLGFSLVILEGDLEMLTKSLMDNSSSLASFGLLIQDVKT